MSSFFALAGTYKIKEFLGEGLNSCVYRAFKESDNLGVRFEVALKILKSETMVSVWRNEFERLSQISSEYCVKLLGWEVSHSGPALVLEYVKGVTLLELKPQLTRADLDEILRQARLGLEHLAEQGLFHGDLSPQNIMIDESGRVKLVDFGVSVEKKNSFVTPKYAAPTVMMGDTPTLASDLVSLDLIREELAREATSKCASELSLAAKVAKARELRRKMQSQTQQLLPKRHLRKYLSRAIVPIVLLTSLFSRGDSQLNHGVTQPRLIVHSHSWMTVQLQGKNLGFAPIDTPIKVGETLHLTWQTSLKHGEQQIVAQPGHNIIINGD